MAIDASISRLLAMPEGPEAFELMAQLVTDESSRVADQSRVLIASTDPRERGLGADLLGQVATIRPDLRASMVVDLVDRLSSENDPSAAESFIVALGHCHVSETLQAVIPYESHPDPDVRAAVAFAAPLLDQNASVTALLQRLSRDIDPRVRDWATFRLAESNDETPETMAALFERTADADGDTRAEGLYGLARRQDPRARALIEEELADPGASDLLYRAVDEIDTV